MEVTIGMSFLCLIILIIYLFSAWLIVSENTKMLRKRIEYLQSENDRLRNGNFTPNEFQNLCHNLPVSCGREIFEKGCIEYQNNLFGSK